MNKNILLAGIILAAIIGFGVFLLTRPKPPAKTTEATQATTPQPETKKTMQDQDSKSLSKPEVTIDQSKTYTATLKTSEGDIMISLHADKTPITVNNFVYLAKQNFYNNTIFHRVIDGFMIQGGDPTGTGAGGPGYKFDDEPFKGEYKRGTVAMANAGPNTNGSQFFIMHKDNELPPNYVIFGTVTEGLDIVDKIASAKTGLSMGGEQSKPVNPVVMSEVVITED